MLQTGKCVCSPDRNYKIIVKIFVYYTCVSKTFSLNMLDVANKDTHPILQDLSLISERYFCALLNIQ